MVIGLLDPMMILSNWMLDYVLLRELLFRMVYDGVGLLAADMTDVLVRRGRLRSTIVSVFEVISVVGEISWMVSTHFLHY